MTEPDELAQALNAWAPNFKGVRETHLRLSQYADGSLALLLDSTWPDGMPEQGTPLSVNLSAYHMHPAEGCVFIKNYGSHVGVAQALNAAGAGKIVRAVPIGFGEGVEFLLAPHILTSSPLFKGE